MIRRAVVVLCALGFACGSNPSGPTTAAISASPSGLALAGATRITFTGTGVDPQGGALSYSWNFGDGTSGSGQTVGHVFSSEGTFNVVLTVAGDRGSNATAAVSVQARSLSGHWTPLQNGGPGIDATIVQSGATLSGQSTNECCTHTFSGSVRDPLAIELVFHFSGCPAGSRTFVGSVSADLNTISLTGPNCNVPSTTYGFTRK